MIFQVMCMDGHDLPIPSYMANEIELGKKVSGTNQGQITNQLQL